MRVDAACDLCGSPSPTVHHILSGCPTALDQGRLTWRHDSVLNILVRKFRHHMTSEYSVYADLPGWMASTSPPSTLPSSISSSSFRPDLVVTNSEEVIILELTICANKQANFSEAKSRKTEKYASLVSDLEGSGLHVTFGTLEVGSLGHYTKDAPQVLRSTLPSLSNKRILDSLAKTSIGCSQLIFNARQCSTWEKDKPFINFHFILFFFLSTLPRAHHSPESKG